MIQINIEMPKDCNNCPFAVHYDSGGAHGFYCSLSNSNEHRWGEANDDGFKFADCPISAVENKMQVLDKIRAEIERLHYHPKLDFIKNDDVVDMTLDIIDKYKAEQGGWRMSMIANQHFAGVDDSKIKSERQAQLKSQYLQGFKDGVESQREFCTDAVSRKAVLKSLCELGYGDEENGAEAEYMYALRCVADKAKALPPVTPETAKVMDLDGLKQDMKALNCGFPYGLDYLLECIKNRLGITIN